MMMINDISTYKVQKNR